MLVLMVRYTCGWCRNCKQHFKKTNGFCDKGPTTRHEFDIVWKDLDFKLRVRQFVGRHRQRTLPAPTPCLGCMHTTPVVTTFGVIGFDLISTSLALSPSPSSILMVAVCWMMRPPLTLTLTVNCASGRGAHYPADTS